MSRAPPQRPPLPFRNPSTGRFPRSGDYRANPALTGFHAGFLSSSRRDGVSGNTDPQTAYRDVLATRVHAWPPHVGLSRSAGSGPRPNPVGPMGTP